MTFKVNLDTSEFKKEAEKLIEKAIRMDDSEEIETFEQLLAKYKATKVEGIGKYKLIKK